MGHPQPDDKDPHIFAFLKLQETASTTSPGPPQPWLLSLRLPQQMMAHKHDGPRVNSGSLVLPLWSLQFEPADAHRSILQQQLQGGVSILVVLGQLSRPPHLLCIRDPHPSGLMNTERTGNTKVKPAPGFRVGVRVAVVRRAPRTS